MYTIEVHSSGKQKRATISHNGLCQYNYYAQFLGHKFIKEMSLVLKPTESLYIIESVLSELKDSGHYW